MLLIGGGVIWAVGAVREAGVASGRTAKGFSGIGEAPAVGVSAMPCDFGVVMEGSGEVSGTVLDEEGEGETGVVKGVGCATGEGFTGPVFGLSAPAGSAPGMRSEAVSGREGESGRSVVEEAAGASCETGGIPAMRWVGGLAGGGVGASRPVENLEDGIGVAIGFSDDPVEGAAADGAGCKGCAAVEMGWEAGFEGNAGAAGLTASGGWGVAGTGISRELTGVGVGWEAGEGRLTRDVPAPGMGAVRINRLVVGLRLLPCWAEGGVTPIRCEAGLMGGGVTLRCCVLGLVGETGGAPDGVAATGPVAGLSP